MSLNVQMLSMLASVLVGIYLGAALDTYFRIFRFRKTLWWIKITCDVLFWLIQALVFFLVLLNVNNGEVRFYLFLAVGLGYATYRALFEVIYRKTLDVLLKMISRIVLILKRMTYLIILNPTKVLLKQLVYSVMIIITTLWVIVSFFLKWTLYPFVFILKWVDKKSGYPLLTQRKKFTKVLKAIMERLRGFYKK